MTLFDIDTLRRGQATTQVQVVENAALTLTPGGAQLLLALRGSFHVLSSAGASHTLQARTGMHWQALDEEWRAEPLGADAVMVGCAFTG